MHSSREVMHPDNAASIFRRNRVLHGYYKLHVDDCRKNKTQYYEDLFYKIECNDD